MKCEQERDERLRSRQQQEELIVSQQQIRVEAGTNGGLDFEEKEANSESCVCNGGKYIL